MHITNASALMLSHQYDISRHFLNASAKRHNNNGMSANFVSSSCKYTSVMSVSLIVRDTSNVFWWCRGFALTQERYGESTTFFLVFSSHGAPISKIIALFYHIGDLVLKNHYIHSGEVSL